MTMDVGDLVRVKQSIKEFVSERGETLGIVLGIHDPQTEPCLGLIQWSDGETENLYSDEVEIVSTRLESP